LTNHKKLYISGVKKRQVNNNQIISELMEIFSLAETEILITGIYFSIPSRLYIGYKNRDFRNFKRRHKIHHVGWDFDEGGVMYWRFHPRQ
jgi:hypothetical protein